MNRQRLKQAIRRLGLTGCMVLLGCLSPGLGTAAVQQVAACQGHVTGWIQLTSEEALAHWIHSDPGVALPGAEALGPPGLTFAATSPPNLASTCPCD